MVSPRVLSDTPRCELENLLVEGELRDSTSDLPLPVASEYADQATREDLVLTRRCQSTPLAALRPFKHSVAPLTLLRR